MCFIEENSKVIFRLEEARNNLYDTLAQILKHLCPGSWLLEDLSEFNRL